MPYNYEGGPGGGDRQIYCTWKPLVYNSGELDVR